MLIQIATRFAKTPSPPRLIWGGEFAVSRASSVVELDTGATATLVCRAWVANHNLFFGSLSMEKVHLYPSAARFKFGDGRIGEVQYAANITVGIAGRKGTFTAFATDAGRKAPFRDA